MPAFITRFIWPFIQKYLIKKLIKLGTYLLAKWQRDKQLEEKAEVLAEAGTSPDLTPEQKAKEIEDAHKNMVGARSKLN
jgi:hypothetical protein